MRDTPREHGSTIFPPPRAAIPSIFFYALDLMTIVSLAVFLWPAGEGPNDHFHTHLIQIQCDSNDLDSIQEMVNLPSIKRDVLFEPDFWWLVGYLQGDGSVDRRNGLWFHSTDIELIRHSQSLVSKLFGLNSRVYVEKRLQPWKSKFRMVVYSRKLVAWLDRQELIFGRKKWNVPSLPLELFTAYLGGLFDAEGNVLIRRNKIKTDKIVHIVIHSTNQQSLSIISEKLGEYGARTILLNRRRTNRPGVYCELRFCEKTNLQWFVNMSGDSVALAVRTVS